jgi:hypothetical protein
LEARDPRAGHLCATDWTAWLAELITSKQVFAQFWSIGMPESGRDLFGFFGEMGVKFIAVALRLVGKAGIMILETTLEPCTLWLFSQ